MLEKIKQSKSIIKQVLKANLILFIASSMIFFIILYFFTLATTTNQSIDIFIMMNGISYTISTFFLLAVISGLFGIYSCLIAYSVKIKVKSKIKGSIGALGFITGLFSAGCPMCGAFLFGLLGMPLALFFMPFKGIELRVLSIFILALSIYLISMSLAKCGNRK